jgi:hypothetical protein
VWWLLRDKKVNIRSYYLMRTSPVWYYRDNVVKRRTALLETRIGAVDRRTSILGRHIVLCRELHLIKNVCLNYRKAVDFGNIFKLKLINAGHSRAVFI